MPEEYLNIGDVWEDNHFNWVIPVQNKYNKDINVKKILASCSCVSIEPKQVEIPAGKSVDLRLVFDLTGRSMEQVGLKERPFEIAVLPLMATSDKIQHRNGWTMRGRIHSRITVNPLALYIGNVRKGEATATESVIVEAHIPIKDLLLDYNEKELIIKKKQFLEDKEMKRYLLEVSISDDMPIGSFKKAIKIRVVGADGKRYPGTQFYVEGVALGDIEAIPPQLVLGCGSLKGSLAKEIVLRSYRGATIKVDDVLIPSQDLTVQPINTSASSCRGYEVTQKVTKIGDQSSIIKIICHSTHDPRPVTLKIPVSYRGLPERMAMVP